MDSISFFCHDTVSWASRRPTSRRLRAAKRRCRTDWPTWRRTARVGKVCSWDSFRHSVNSNVTALKQASVVCFSSIHTETRVTGLRTGKDLEWLFLGEFTSTHFKRNSTRLWPNIVCKQRQDETHNRDRLEQDSVLSGFVLNKDLNRSLGLLLAHFSLHTFKLF